MGFCRILVVPEDAPEVTEEISLVLDEVQNYLEAFADFPRVLEDV